MRWRGAGDGLGEGEGLGSGEGLLAAVALGVGGAPLEDGEQEGVSPPTQREMSAARTHHRMSMGTHSHPALIGTPLLSAPGP